MKRFLAKLPSWILIWLYALLVILPLYFVLITCFKTSAEVTLNPFGLPASFTLNNFKVAIEHGHLLRAMRNSLLTSVGATIMQMVIGLAVSYCLYKLREKKIGVILYMVVLSTLFIPGTGWVMLIKLYQKLGLYNSIWGVMLNSGTGRLAFNTFILVGAMRAVPRELEQAALLDGCSDLQYLFRVLTPCIKPSLVSIGIFSFTSSWNSLMTPLLLLRKEETFTLPLALKYLQSGTGEVVQYNYLFAGIVFSGALLVILYLFCQKYFVTALAGSVKG